MNTDEEPDDEAQTGPGRPRGSADTYQRQRESTRQRRADRLLELGDALLDTGRPEEERNSLARIMLALLLNGWNRETYLSDPTRPDIIAKLLEPLPPSKAPTKRKRSVTNHPGL